MPHNQEALPEFGRSREATNDAILRRCFPPVCRASDAGVLSATANVQCRAMAHVEDLAA